MGNQFSMGGPKATAYRRVILLLLAFVSAAAMVLTMGVAGVGVQQAQAADRQLSLGTYWTKLPNGNGIAPGKYRVTVPRSAGHYQYVSVYRDNDSDLESNRSTNYSIDPGESKTVNVPADSAVVLDTRESSTWSLQQGYANWRLQDASAPVTRNGGQGVSYAVGGNGIAPGLYQVSMASGDYKQDVEILAKDGSEIHSYHVGWFGTDNTWLVTVPANAARVRLSYPDKTVWRKLTTRPAYQRVRDVNASTPHQSDVIGLMRSGISTGWEEPDGSVTFRGGAAVTRQDMAAFLYRLAGSPAYNAGRSPFVDVNASTPHYKEVLWLASTGISTGWNTPRGKEFRGGATVKRQDMAAFLKRLAAWRKANPRLGASVSFLDVNGATPHSADIAWLARTGVTAGWNTPRGKEFRGMNDVVRQDMAAFLQRMKTNVIK